MYSIYKLTLPNGKSYVGQTSQKPYKRWAGGSGYAENKELHNDILEYGWRNVIKEILEEVEDGKEALVKEREYILKYKSNEPEFGYNKHINDNTVGAKPPSRTRKLGLVRCVETGETFESGAEAARQCSVTRAALDYAIKHGTTCAKLHWERLAASNGN